MKDFGMAGVLILGLSSFFIMAWLGAFFTREGRLLAPVVTKHFRLIVMTLVVIHFVCSGEGNPGWVSGVDAVASLLLMAMFVPLLRRFQKKPDKKGSA